MKRWQYESERATLESRKARAEWEAERITAGGLDFDTREARDRLKDAARDLGDAIRDLDAAWQDSKAGDERPEW